MGPIVIALAFIAIVCVFWLIPAWLYDPDKEPPRRPLRCVLGLHSWYTDSAWFSSAERCRNCDGAQDEQEMSRLESERQIWAEVKEVEGISFEDAQLQVAVRLSEWESMSRLDRIVRARGAAEDQ